MKNYFYNISFSRIKRFCFNLLKLYKLVSKNKSLLAKIEPSIKSARKDDKGFIRHDCLYETEYYFEKGLRKVVPYYYNYSSNAKKRWFGKKLLEVFSSEFYSMHPQILLERIQDGRLKVNNIKINPDYVIKNGDVITNRIHRHELAVLDKKLEIIKEDEDVLIVDKPASWPVHPCAQYRHNSLLFILAKEHSKNNLKVVHRLDRLTSGVLILAKTTEKAFELSKDIKSRMVKKSYVAQVHGRFPSGKVVCDKGITELSKKLGVGVVSEDGLGSCTVFKLLSTDATTSLVQCEPQTGRTHQIRIHLQYLGFPIVNDSLYDNPAWGDDRGKSGNYGKSRVQLIKDLDKWHRSQNFITSSEDFVNPSIATGEPINHFKENKRIVRTNSNNQLNRQSIKSKILLNNSYDENCMECIRDRPDPLIQQLSIRLHALSYQFPSWNCQTDLPYWVER